MQRPNETVWANPGAISLRTVVLAEHLMHIHDRCIRRHLPAPQRQALVYVEGLKSIVGFHLRSLFYTSELFAALAPCQTLPHFCGMGFTTGGSRLFAAGLHGALCEGTFHTCPECCLSGMKIVSVNEGEKGQGAAINYQEGPNSLSAQPFRVWQCIKILSICKTSLVCEILCV